ncbi:hypothetical protein DFH09DRAFT_1208884 [Mycena vulgaris]|nr:hypothetical protein DFH09DRAFT_1208884 [Mycena vulgaris]
MADNSTSSLPADSFYNDSVNLVSSTTIAAVAYGVMFTLWSICVYFLLQQIRTSSRERVRSVVFLVYISLLFVLGTIYLATTTLATQLSYVQNHNFPGGPAAYNNFVLFSEPVGILSNVSYILANWMADGLLVGFPALKRGASLKCIQLWRLVILYQGSPYTTYIVAFPFLLYLGTIAMGLLLAVQVSLPTKSLWSNGEINFALPYFVLSMSMTVIATSLMIGRLLLARKRLQRLLGSNDASVPYTGVAAMVVESCALYSSFSLIFIVLYAVNTPIQYVFLSSLANVQIIAPLLIIFRVSQGKAWTRNTEKSLGSTTARPGVHGEGNSASVALSSLAFSAPDKADDAYSKREQFGGGLNSV